MASNSGTAKLDADALALRARPRSVTRINRRVLLLVSGFGTLLIAAAALFALDPPRLFNRDQTGRELIRTGNKPEGLETLPRRYSDLPQPVELGPPLPGDLGGAIMDKERELGLEPVMPLPFRPNPEDDAARAERIRQARLAQQGRESQVFFQLTSHRGANAGEPLARDSAADSTNLVSRNPFEGLNATEALIGLRADTGNDQNQQDRKIAFLSQGVDANIYSPYALQDPASPYQVMAGTVIAASLITGINSDLPGRVIAQVTENVYDTVAGRFLLIPQGSRIIGSYDSVVAFGQERALVVWQRIIMPDGSSILIDNLPATDTAGYAGLRDQVNFHTWQLLQGIVLSTLLGVGTELTLGKDESDLVRALRQSAQDSTNQVGQRITERNLNIQPTITVRPGWPLRIIVHKDMVLRPYRG